MNDQQMVRDAKTQGDSAKNKALVLEAFNTKSSSPREIPFNGVRLRFDSNKFHEVLSSLLADVGDKPLLINEVAAKSESWDSYSKEIESRLGPSGFILFDTKVGIRRKAVRLIHRKPNDCHHHAAS
jgi:hypothetical protein